MKRLSSAFPPRCRQCAPTSAATAGTLRPLPGLAPGGTAWERWGGPDVARGVRASAVCFQGLLVICHAAKANIAAFPSSAVNAMSPHPSLGAAGAKVPSLDPWCHRVMSCH